MGSNRSYLPSQKLWFCQVGSQRLRESLDRSCPMQSCTPPSKTAWCQQLGFGIGPQTLQMCGGLGSQHGGSGSFPSFRNSGADVRTVSDQTTTTTTTQRSNCTANGATTRNSLVCNLSVRFNLKFTEEQQHWRMLIKQLKDLTICQTSKQRHYRNVSSSASAADIKSLSLRIPLNNLSLHHSFPIYLFSFLQVTCKLFPQPRISHE